MLFEGYRGSMELTDTYVNVWHKGDKEERCVLLSQIVSIIVKKPGFTSNGLIFLQTIGSKGTSATMTKFDYGMDKNTVFFTKSSYQEALDFKAYIENAISNLKTSPVVSEYNNGTTDLTSQLKELRSLVEQGLITENDYEEKKRSLLNL